MKIAVLVSGGVDSSVALRLLKDQGHELTAFYLKIWLEDEIASLGQCPWEEDLSYIRLTCEQVGVSLEVVSMQRAYWEHIVSYTIAEARAGRTPNPDIFCNKWIKFGLFWEKIKNKGFDKVASGHYAQIGQKNGEFQLICSPDDVKDQTYFLSYLNQEELSRIVFPIGYLNKQQVREFADKYNLPNKDRKDSQGICFLGKLKFDEFVKYHMGESKGDLIEVETNKKLGQHNGYWFYTIGQRKGSGLSGGPWYVVSKDIKNNIVYLSRHYYESNKVRDSFEVNEINWINGKIPTKTTLQVKLRHGKHRHSCTIRHNNDRSAHVKLHARDQGIAAGQFAVFYDEKFCLGGGVITKSL